MAVQAVGGRPARRSARSSPSTHPYASMHPSRMRAPMHACRGLRPTAGRPAHLDLHAGAFARAHGPVPEERRQQSRAAAAEVVLVSRLEQNLRKQVGASVAACRHRRLDAMQCRRVPASLPCPWEVCAVWVGGGGMRVHAPGRCCKCCKERWPSIPPRLAYGWPRVARL